MSAATLNRDEETKLTLLIRNIIGNLQQVHITKRHTNVLGLATSESASEMRVAKHTSGTSTVHGTLSGVGVCLLTLGRELLFTEEAVTASNLERSDVAPSDIDARDASADLVNNTAELVAQDVTLGELNDCSMEEMQVRTADGAACDSEDDIAVFDDLWLRSVDCRGLLVFDSKV
jgi:hypothetical protein